MIVGEIRNGTIYGGSEAKKYTSPIDRDFYVPKLAELLKTPSLELSRLVWRTLTTLPSYPDYLQATYPDYLQATYQRNQSWGARVADSMLVHELRNAAWVPQSDGKFVRPAEASRGACRKGFLSIQVPRV